MSATGLADRPFDREAIEAELAGLRSRLVLDTKKKPLMGRACGSVVDLLERTPGATLQERWTAVEEAWWSEWEEGDGRLEPAPQWTWGAAALVLSRAVRPGWELLSRARLSQWIGWLPADDPLPVQMAWLRERFGRIEWAGADTCSASGSCCATATPRPRRSPRRICVRCRCRSPRGWTRSTRCSARRASSTAARGAAPSGDCAAGASPRPSWSPPPRSPSASGRSTVSTSRPTSGGSATSTRPPATSTTRWRSSGPSSTPSIPTSPARRRCDDRTCWPSSAGRSNAPARCSAASRICPTARTG